MVFSKSIMEIIKNRRSCRTYSSEPIGKSTLEKIKMYLESLSDNNFRFKLVTRNDTNNQGIRLGTYGMIRGAKTFIVGIMDISYENTEIFGYAFEKLVLFLTDMGLGTCWLGGTFNKQDFSKTIQLKINEYIPIVTPVGYSGNGFNLMNSMARLIAGSDKRMSWEKLFYENSFTSTLSPVASAEYQIPLEMVRLAPSASNKQPWRILKNENRFHFFLNRDPHYNKLLKYDIQKNDLGIAMSHFQLCAEELTLQGYWIFDKAAHGLSQSFEYITTWQCGKK